MLLNEEMFDEVETVEESLVNDYPEIYDYFKEEIYSAVRPIFYKYNRDYSGIISPQADLEGVFRDITKRILSESLEEDLAAQIQKLHDTDEYLWNLHGTDYTWLYDELDKYSDDWKDSDSKDSIADCIRRMPKEKQHEILDRLVEPMKESLKEDFDDIVDIEVPVLNINTTEIDADDTTPKGPEVGEDTGIADLLLTLINGENDTIRDYNSFKANLSSHPEFIPVIEDITNEENNHVGMLQTLLKQISPNVATIEQGQLEAEHDLEKEDEEAISDTIVIDDVDDIDNDPFLNYYKGI